jgi:hypothetical protein
MLYFARFEVYTTVFLSVQIFWNMALCCWVSGPRRSEGSISTSGTTHTTAQHHVIFRLESFERSKTILRSSKKVK